MTRLKSLALLTGAVVLSGCAGEFEPWVFGFDYDISTYTLTTQNAIVRGLSNGTNPITNFLPPVTCSFIADFSGNRAVTTFNGDPGQSGFKILLNSVNANNISTADPTASPTVESLVFLAGGSSGVWGAGDETRQTSFEVSIDGEVFTSRYFRAELYTAPSNNYVTGEFEFVGVSSSGQTIIGTGPFSLKD